MANPPVGLNLHPTVPEQNTGVAPGASRYSGGLAQSLGGVRGLAPLPVHFPFSQEIEYAKVASQSKRTPASWHRLFKDFTAAQLTAGRTVYRALMLHHDGQDDFRTMKLWLTQPRSGTAITIGLETPVADVIQRVASETTAPAGVSFTAPTSAAMLSGPTPFEEDDAVGIWVKQVVGAGQAAYPFDYWGLHLQVTDDATPAVTHDTRSWYFFQHLLVGITISTVTTSRVAGAQTYVNRGETFTITMSGSPTDPGQNRVFVYLSGPAGFGDEFEAPGLEVPVELCDRSSAGVYTYQWRPCVPGFYVLEFNIGEDFYRLERNVLP